MKIGLEVFTQSKAHWSLLKDKRVALLANPASADRNIIHALDLIHANKEIQLTAAFGPQHGMRGDVQDNMIETSDYKDPKLGIPVYSLYGPTRKPTPEMMDSFDVILVDLQDVGCRIYTYITTLLYMMEACAQTGKALWVLDRPNLAGREIEGNALIKGEESFVGAAPIPMRYGLTIGEIARYYKKEFNLKLDLKVIKLEDYRPNQAPGYGWESGDRPWVNPSPNIASLNAVRCFSGTVLLEGTTISEGRGTTIPLELMGAPDLDLGKIFAEMDSINSKWKEGCLIRTCHFEPTFHKYQGKMCKGFQIHTDFPEYRPEVFKPFRLVSTFLKALRNVQPDYDIWDPKLYEYEKGRKAIDVIQGGSQFREWVDNPDSQWSEWDSILIRDEKAWSKSSKEHLIY